MGLHDKLAKGEPEPRAHSSARLTGLDLSELIKDPAERFGRDSLARVCYRELQNLPFGPLVDKVTTPLRA